MADPGKGRGRGLALLKALKSQMMETQSQAEQPAPERTPTPSVASNVVSFFFYITRSPNKFMALLNVSNYRGL